MAHGGGSVHVWGGISHMGKTSLCVLDQMSLEPLIAEFWRTTWFHMAGPDEVPNELFIEANNYTIQLLTDLLNIVHMRKNIPDEWRKGIITRLYKGKEGKVNAQTKEV